MGIKIDMDEFVKKLYNQGFSEEEVSKIISTFIEGIPMTVTPNTFNIDAGKNFNVKIYEPNGENPTRKSVLLVSNFEADIDGIESSKILSIEIPKLDYRNNEALTIKVEYVPFELEYPKFCKKEKV